MSTVMGWVVVRNDTFLGLAKDKKTGVSAYLWSTFAQDALIFREEDEALRRARNNGGVVYPANNRPKTCHELLAVEVARKERVMATKAATKENKAPKASTGPAHIKAELFGVAASRVGKWMGANGYNVEQYRKLLTANKQISKVTPSSVSTAISDGRNPKYATNLPELTQAQQKEIKSICGAPGTKDEKPAKSTKAAAAVPAKKAAAKVTGTTAVVSKNVRNVPTADLKPAVAKKPVAVKKAVAKKK